MINISTIVIQGVNRKNNNSDKDVKICKKIYSLMGVSINLYMLMKEMFPCVLSAWPIDGYPYDVGIVTCM